MDSGEGKAKIAERIGRTEGNVGFSFFENEGFSSAWCSEKGWKLREQREQLRKEREEKRKVRVCY